MRSVQSLRVEDKFSSSGLVQKHILLPDRNPSLLLNLSERKHRHEHCLLFMEKLSALNTQLSSLRPFLSLSLFFFTIVLKMWHSWLWENWVQFHLHSLLLWARGFQVHLTISAGLSWWYLSRLNWPEWLKSTARLHRHGRRWFAPGQGFQGRCSTVVHVYYTSRQHIL